MIEMRRLKNVIIFIQTNLSFELFFLVNVTHHGFLQLYSSTRRALWLALT